jgi:hypothetical protein
VTGVPGKTSHDVHVDRDIVTKTYRFWHRGEPDREWAGLTFLAEHAPGLAPCRCTARSEMASPSS